MEYRTNNMNLNKNHAHDNNIDDNRDINIYDQDTINYYYQTSKTVASISCNTIIEIISIFCIVICSILLIVSTWILTTSIHINVLVNSSNYPQYQYRIPKLNNSVLMYVTTICNRISDCFDIYRIDTHNIDIDINIKQEPSSHSTENSYDADDESDKNGNEHDNCHIDNNHIDIDSDIEDITERMLQLRIDTTEVVDLREDTVTHSTITTSCTPLVVNSQVSDGIHNNSNNTSDSDNSNDNEIDKQLYYNIESHQHNEEYRPETNSE
jgi:hypothetical protein